MKKYFFMFVTIFLFIFLVGCSSVVPINEEKPEIIPEREIFDGYVVKSIDNFEYQIPSFYKDARVDAHVNISEKTVSVSLDEAVINTKAVIITGISSTDDYKNSNQFLYDLSKYIDGNQNEMFTYAEKKINDIPWIIGDNYIMYKYSDELEIRYQVKAGFYKKDQDYYGILFAFPNTYAGKSNDYEYPEFEDEVKNVFASLVIKNY